MILTWEAVPLSQVERLPSHRLAHPAARPGRVAP